MSRTDRRGRRTLRYKSLPRPHGEKRCHRRVLSNYAPPRTPCGEARAGLQVSTKPPRLVKRIHSMGRIKAISDDQVLNTARTVFSEHGHAAATRDVAKAAGL